MKEEGINVLHTHKHTQSITSEYISVIRLFQIHINCRF